MGDQRFFALQAAGVSGIVATAHFTKQILYNGSSLRSGTGRTLNSIADSSTGRVHEIEDGS